MPASQQEGPDRNETPPLIWGDRYDAIGLAAGLPVGTALAVLFESTGAV